MDTTGLELPYYLREARIINVGYYVIILIQRECDSGYPFGWRI